MSEDRFEVLTLVGPQTPMGRYLREFWFPIGRSAEFVVGQAPLRLMALGEKLIGYRDSLGRVGVLDHRCPHRCASLFFGRNEEGGLRCAYHGWKFDIDGNCLEQPNILPERRFADRVKAKAYKVHESRGVVWVYMGTCEDPPSPVIPGLGDAGDDVEMLIYVRECNWLQGMEGDLDPSHLGFLHHGSHKPEAFEESPVAQWITSGRETEVEVEEAVWGLVEGQNRPTSVSPDYWSFTLFLQPTWTMPGQASFDDDPTVRCWLPMDDRHAMVFQFVRSRGLNEGRSAFLMKIFGKAPGVIVKMPELYHPNSPDWYGRYRMTPSEENDYFIDREAQSDPDGIFTGINGIHIQDKAITESMGAIVDRSGEHLCSNDLLIARTRQRLLEAVRVFETSGTLPPMTQNPSLYEGALAGGGSLPSGMTPIEFYASELSQRGRDPGLRVRSRAGAKAPSGA